MPLRLSARAFHRWRRWEGAGGGRGRPSLARVHCVVLAAPEQRAGGPTVFSFPGRYMLPPVLQRSPSQGGTCCRQSYKRSPSQGGTCCRQSYNVLLPREVHVAASLTAFSFPWEVHVAASLTTFSFPGRYMLPPVLQRSPSHGRYMLPPVL